METPTPKTDKAYFGKCTTMYELAGEMKLLERENTKLKAEMNRWRKVPEVMPGNGQRVVAHYAGVYQYRLATFWHDGFNAHFGYPNEADGKGSQPATHWLPLPDVPNTETDRTEENEL